MAHEIVFVESRDLLEKRVGALTKELLVPAELISPPQMLREPRGCSRPDIPAMCLGRGLSPRIGLERKIHTPAVGEFARGFAATGNKTLDMIKQWFVALGQPADLGRPMA